MHETEIAERMLKAARELRDSVAKLRFAVPVTHVYNPLEYAWAAHEAFVRRYAKSRKRAVFLGMNPGPFGMAQTGVPFGEIAAVRDWLGISAAIESPTRTHPKRPITGFDCPRTEISGQRLWRRVAQTLGPADKVFPPHLLVDYLPP